MTKLKNFIYSIVSDEGKKNKISNIFSMFILSLIVINVVIVIADTFNLPKTWGIVFYYIELGSVVIFTIEYLLRFWTADCRYINSSPWRARIKYIFSFMAMIDLLSVLPFYIPFIIPIDLRVLRMLRMIRLLRIFKVNRYTNALSTIGTVLKNKASQLLSSVLVVLLLMIIASVLMYNIESTAQPDKFKNAFSGLWWAVATFTTVGYGDIYPITTLGKILSGIIALLGIGLVAVPTGIISAGFMEVIEKDKETEQKHYCPYCGKNLD